MAERSWLWGCVFVGLWSLILSKTEDRLEVPENSAATLPCKATQNNAKRTEWKFEDNGNVVLFYHDNQLTDAYKDRVTFFSNEILFKSVTRKDSGRYTCMVLGNTFDESVVDLVVQVPPSKPKAQVPSVVTIGSKAVLSCVETDGNPRPTFKWFRNNSEMPSDPKSNSLFRNSSYVLDSSTGVLTFNPATAFDAGEYYCVAENKVGAPQKSDTVQMQTSELNVGGIVAGVVVLLLVLALVVFGIWFAYSRGYLRQRKGTTGSKKVIYSQPSKQSEGEFKQTSSFLV
ncbi:junctional adhesion molecule A [Varanus komodoensis]|uniref:junctional adhesion molecule A n=1 Tax=Varanus komodoensis TaxID=61221 RepID=UPI001CF7D121|nr:junctional adhesion molecule A [Varanus komodoensis]